MPRLGAIKRRDLVAYLRQLGFEGPVAGGKHEFMLRADVTVRLPNPHEGDISVDLLTRILRQAGIDRKEWEAL